MAILTETGVHDFESLGRTPDGGIFSTEVHARLVALPRFGKVLVSVIQNITARLAADEAIRYLAFHDALTGLSNRLSLGERLRMAISNADRHGDIVGIAFLDLDDFKPVNDTYGHAVGDQVLQTIAARLTECVRDSDTVARMGGDEFLVLFERLSSRDELAGLGRKICDSVAEPVEVEGHRVTTSVTTGLATYRPGESPAEFIDRADRAMYRARADGLEGCDEFSPDA